MRLLVRRHEVWIFLVLVIPLNALFVWGIATGLLPRGLYNYGRFLLLGGTLAAVVLVARGGGGVTDLIRPLGRWRVDPRWYLFGLLWGATMASLVLLLMTPFGGDGLSLGSLRLGPLARPGVLASILVGSLIGEVVWVGYALKQLAPRFGTFAASQVVGVAWALWWFPMVLFNVGVIPGLPLVALVINQAGVAAICALIYARTGSGLAVLVTQLSFNAAMLVVPVSPAVAGVATYWVFALLYWVAALALHLALGSVVPLTGWRAAPPRSTGLVAPIGFWQGFGRRGASGSFGIGEPAGDRDVGGQGHEASGPDILRPLGRSPHGEVADVVERSGLSRLQDNA